MLAGLVDGLRACAADRRTPREDAAVRSVEGSYLSRCAPRAPRGSTDSIGSVRAHQARLLQSAIVAGKGVDVARSTAATPSERKCLAKQLIVAELVNIKAVHHLLNSSVARVDQGRRVEPTLMAQEVIVLDSCAVKNQFRYGLRAEQPVPVLIDKHRLEHQLSEPILDGPHRFPASHCVGGPSLSHQFQFAQGATQRLDDLHLYSCRSRHGADRGEAIQRPQDPDQPVQRQV